MAKVRRETFDVGTLGGGHQLVEPNQYRSSQVVALCAGAEGLRRRHEEVQQAEAPLVAAGGV